MKIEQETLVEAFSDCVGQRKAEEVIADITAEAGLEDGVYTEQEAIEIAAKIANSERSTTYVRTAANTLQTRIQTGNV